MRALVDTGASAVAMNLSEAQVGEIVVYDVEATLSERDELPITLLGMSFLRHLDMYRSGSSLTLTRRH